MSPMNRDAPCPGFALPITYPDVEPNVLADEEASERRRGMVNRMGDPWPAYLQRVLPRVDPLPARRDRLRGIGAREELTLAVAQNRSRRALAEGDANGARFWDDVMQAIRAG